jgi:nicotinamide-nucleotide amidase
MKAAIITIGDEILIGTTIDTNSAWLAEKLNLLGISIYEIISVSDEKFHIMSALKRAEEHAQLILITGGLGPTNDDITKKTLADYFNAELKLFPEVYKVLKEYFDHRGIQLSEKNRTLAELPANCTAIRNPKGTAWGMWFEERGKVYVSMPGVPWEMKSIMHDTVLPKLKQKFSLPAILHYHILTAAIAESQLAEKLTVFEAQLPANFKLAYLPDMGFVKLRLSATGNNMNELRQQMNHQVERVKADASKHIYGFENDIFEQVIGNMLAEKNMTIATAESCTGGYIAHRITTVAGSSAYYKGSVIAYANEVKTAELGVSPHTIQQQGAVSEQTVKEMLTGVIKKLNTDMGIAVSGIAGPDGGTDEKPVGTVWIAVGNETNMVVRQVQLPGNRKQIITLTAVVALEMLRRFLLK